MSYSLLDSIGNTPVVEINRLNPFSNVKILAKLEYMNPGGSIKDRAALSMIENGEKSGELTKARTVIEATSGNTGIGLAMICSVKGYKLVLTMSESASEERKKILKARGAEIILTPGHLGSDGAIEEVYRLARENPDKYFMTDQYNNDANWKAHYHTTAMEIFEQTKGKVNSVVASLGTSGTLMGLSKRLKELNPDIRIIGAEPYLGHGIQGLKNMKESYVPDIFDKKLLDEKINIEDEKAFEITRELAQKEGLFVGMSSGAAMAAALKEAEKMKSGILVVIFPDSGERYLSTSLFVVKDNITLNLFNTLSRKKELFKPGRQGRASVYTCGPTVHKRMDMGQLRRFVAADLLCRYLEFSKISVNHIVNITDLDDKTIQESERAGESLEKFTEKYTRTFKEDLNRLNIREAQGYPLVSEHVDEMVNLANRLAENGSAYEKLRSLYFDISTLTEYGILSNVDLDKIRVGATVDLDDYEKDNPRDFTLLKRVRLSELKRGVCIKTKWGSVRPSLHLQCAAISMKYLGENFDIHTGARELVFPHHENENAIAMAATGSLLANHWMHCDGVSYDGFLEQLTMNNEQRPGNSSFEGMGYEDTLAGNLENISLDTLEKMGWDSRVVRFWLISTHYSKTLHLSEQALNDAKFSLKRFDRCFDSLAQIRQGEQYKDLDQFLYDLKHGFSSALDDDLKITDVVALLFKSVKKLNRLMDIKGIDHRGAGLVLELFKEIDSVLKIFKFEPEKVFSGKKIEELFKKREQAREKKDWDLADSIRNELNAMGVESHDKKV
ncbi:MAG: cysteine synthase [Thermodesulfobacteriota bacterium]|nr:cysteine synthase [Thermodesulfobacteriota bacterium]